MVGRPPKLSEGAERLTGVVGHAQVLSGGFDPSYKPHAREVKRIVAVIVTELGITPAMVEVLKRLDGDLRQNSFKVGGDGPESAAGEVAHALSTLLEVAGQ